MIVEKSRKGSALLIVIGMLSFMVVSAVSFSIYMRQSRVPSSYLRRASSSRYLLKAALAHAIDRLDGTFASYTDINTQSYGVEGVYDDPYPGVGPSQETDTAAYHRRNGDFWDHRVFTPFGPVSPDRTVSTLTLEGLAYIPPALINEARIYSRQTMTAMWRNLSYDMGRYAFSAIDVSDCFDINRVRAGERRTSAPDGRVNLSSLYDTNGSTLDQKLKRWEDDDIPFISVADFNIAAGQSPFTPFYKYIGSTSSEIYSSGDANTVSNALFITDTWFPATNSTTSVKRYDLASKQPFKRFQDNNMTLIGAMRDCPTSDLGQDLMKAIGPVGMACLYDYLDRDIYPTSFCIPSVETAPMICGISFAPAGFTPKVSPDEDVIEGNYQLNGGKTTITWKATRYSLKRLCGGGCTLGITAAFPFKRIADKNSSHYKTSFKPEVLVRVFMGPQSMKCRVNDNSSLYPGADSDWNDSVKTVDGMVTAKCTSRGSFSFSDVKRTSDAVKSVNCPIDQLDVDMPVYWKVEQWQEDNETGGGKDAYGTPYYVYNGLLNGGLSPRNENGDVESWWKTVAAGPAPQGGDNVKPPPEQSGISEAAYVPHVAVWVRLTSGGETVDMAPACSADDDLWGAGESVDLARAGYLGGGCPILEFRGDKAFSYSKGGKAAMAHEVLTGELDQFSQWNSLWAADPRYNYAPEDWLPRKEAGDQTTWITLVGAESNSGVLGKEVDGYLRDKDIFMFTSDQEYLQSIGELEFLPKIQYLNRDATLRSCQFFANATILSVNGAPDMASRVFSGNTLTSLANLANGEYMWRTYSAYDGDPIYDLRVDGKPVEICSGVGDFRVNPFSSDMRVLMAALKDTPFDYHVASTNTQLNSTANDKPSSAKNYAFTKRSECAPLDDDELQDLALKMRDSFAESAKNGSSWESAFEELEWYRNSEYGDEQLSLFGVDLNNPLHGVDRKYLHAFWRDCFQNRQQLFLVFIRAEPLSVGGSASSTSANSQLGARGVALVWRDPAPPVRGGNRPSRLDLVSREQWRQFYQSYAPHRTRVLFYHQFE